jgi:hypothetical protein
VDRKVQPTFKDDNGTSISQIAGSREIVMDPNLSFKTANDGGAGFDGGPLSKTMDEKIES